MRPLRKYRIGKVYISATTPIDAASRIVEMAQSGISNYICVSNVRTVTIANKDSAYRQVMNRAAMCLPDGMPLVWMARCWGLKNVQRTVGPDLFVRMISKRGLGLKHFLLGDTEETLAAMQAKFSNTEAADIVGVFSPPFCDLDAYDYPAIADRINKSGANVVWLSLRAPKQDFFSTRLLPYLEHAVCIGVGAAFRFSLGEIKHPPKVIKKMGLTGLYWRKFSFRQFWWYIYHLYVIISYGLNILYSRVRGEKVKY